MATEKKVFISIGLATILLLVGGVWLLTAQDAKEQTKLSKPLLGEAIANQGANHVPDGTKVEYNSNPPTSGPHYTNPQLAGIYDKPIPDGNLLHSMEHGAVILWYKQSFPADKPTDNSNNQPESTGSAIANKLSTQDVDRLKQIFDSASVSKKIMVPRNNMDTIIALTSWGRLLKLSTIDENQIKAFLETNEDRGPEKAPL